MKILAPGSGVGRDLSWTHYIEHAAESACFKNEKFDGERPYAVYFSKRVNIASRDGAPIPSYPGLVDSLDYEAELAVTLGKDAKNIPAEQVKDYILDTPL